MATCNHLVICEIERPVLSRCFSKYGGAIFLRREAARVMQCNDGRAAARAFKASDVSESMVTSGSYAG
jgi:hypothetical protein